MNFTSGSLTRVAPKREMIYFVQVGMNHSTTDMITTNTTGQAPTVNPMQQLQSGFQTASALGNGIFGSTGLFGSQGPFSGIGNWFGNLFS